MKRWKALFGATAVAAFICWTDLMYASGGRYQRDYGSMPNVWITVAVEAIVVLLVLAVLLWLAGDPPG